MKRVFFIIVLFLISISILFSEDTGMALFNVKLFKINNKDYSSIVKKALVSYKVNNNIINLSDVIFLHENGFEQKEVVAFLVVLKNDGVWHEDAHFKFYGPLNDIPSIENATGRLYNAKEGGIELSFESRSSNFSFSAIISE